MKLDQNVVTTNYLENVKKHFGNCFGMTISWINNSIKYNGVTSSWQIGNGVITQARLVNQWNRQNEIENIRNAGLMVVNTHNTFQSLGLHTGYFVIIIDNPAHAMGALIEGNKFQFFDPNNGLYNATDFNDLYNGIWYYLNYEYVGWSLRHLFAIK